MNLLVFLGYSVAIFGVTYVYASWSF